MTDALSDAIVAAGLASGDHAGVTAHLLSAASPTDSPSPFSSARRAYSRGLLTALTSIYDERSAFEPLLSHREPTLPPSASQTESLALSALSTLLRASGSAPGLARLTPDVLSAMAAFATALEVEAPLALFDEWYHLPRVVGRELFASDAVASQCKPGFSIASVFGRDRSLHEVWRSGAVPDGVLSATNSHSETVWMTCVLTPSSHATLLSDSADVDPFLTVHVKFPGDVVIPRFLTISASTSSSGPFTELTSMDMTSPPDDANWMSNADVVQQCGFVFDVSLPHSFLVTEQLSVRISFAGRLASEAPTSDDGYGVSCVRLYGPPKDDHVVTDMRSVIAALSKWLGEVFVAAPASPSRTGVLQFLLSLACTTGSFGVLMTTCESVLRAIEPPTRGELTAIRAYSSQVLSTASTRARQAAVTAWQKQCDEASTSRIRFHPYASTNVALSDNWRVARGSNTSPSIARIDMFMTGRHCFEWSLEIDNCECWPAVGVLVRPTGSASQDPGNPWVNIVALRTDGVVFVNARALPSFLDAPLPPHSVITVTLNLPVRTLTFSVNSVAVGRVIYLPDTLLAAPFQPVVVFDATKPACTVSLVAFQRQHQPVNALSGAPVLLCDVPPAETTLGRGELGLGSDLGLLPEALAPSAPSPAALVEAFNTLADSLSTPAVADATPSLVCQHRQVCVGGVRPEACVVMAPPDEGTASVVYSLSKAFEQLKFRIAMPDYITETLSTSTFRVLGDGKQLWTSQPIERLPGTPNVVSEEFVVSVAGVDKLTLTLTASGVAALSQGVWVDPIIIPISVSSADSHSSPSQSVTLELEELQPGSGLCSDATPSIATRSHVQCALEVLRQAMAWTVGYFSGNTAVPSPWWRVNVQGQPPVVSKYSTDTFDVVRGWRGAPKRADASNPVEPFCCEPFADVLHTALSVLQQLYSYTHDATVSVDPQVKLGALLLEIETLKHVKVMLQPFVNASPEMLEAHGFSANSPFSATQDVVLRFVDSPNASGHYATVTKVAMDIITENVSIFYPDATAVVALYDRLATPTEGSPIRLLDPMHPLFGVVLAAFSQFRQSSVASPLRWALVPFDHHSSPDYVHTPIKLLQLMTFTSIRCISSPPTACFSDPFSQTVGPHVINDVLLQLIAEISHVNLLDSSLPPLRDLQHAVAFRRVVDALVTACEEIVEAAEAVVCRGDVPVSVLRVRLQQSPLFTVLPSLLLNAEPLLKDIHMAKWLLDHLATLMIHVNHITAKLVDKEVLATQRHVWDMICSAFKDNQLTLACRNVFTTEFSGECDNFDGQVGYCFTVNDDSDVVVTGLGRSVSAAVRGGKLQDSHTIRLWHDDSQTIIAQVDVCDDNPMDPVGYKYSSLPAPITLKSGQSYRITSSERAGSGDGWFKSPDRSEDEITAMLLASYDTKSITITRDCYSSAVTGAFPETSSGRMCPLGVPTMYFESTVPTPPHNGGVPVFAEVAGVSKSKSRDNLDVYAVEGDAAVTLTGEIPTLDITPFQAAFSIEVSAGGKVSFEFVVGSSTKATLSLDSSGIVNWNDGVATLCVPLFGNISNTAVVLRCDSQRGLVEASCRGCDGVVLVGPPGSGALFEVQLREHLFGDGQVEKWTIKPSCFLPKAACVIVGAPPNTHPNAIVIPAVPTNFANPSVEWGLFAPPLQPIENPFVYQSNLHRPVCPPWLVTLQFAMAHVIQDCVAVVGLGQPDSEVDEFVAPWLSLPVLCNGPSQLSDDLSPKVLENISFLEDYFQATYPEPALLQRRAKFPSVESLLIAAIARHTGAAPHLLALLNAEVSPSALKGNVPALEAERARLPPSLTGIWARVKAFRQWLRGKKQFFQKFEGSEPIAPPVDVQVPSIPEGYWSELSAVARSNTKHLIRKQRVLETTPITFDEFLAGVTERLVLLNSCAASVVEQPSFDSVSQAILSYARYGTHVPPVLIRRAWQLRQIRASFRLFALEKVALILNGEGSSPIVGVVLSSLRHVCHSVSFSDAEAILKDCSHNGLLQLIDFPRLESVQVPFTSPCHYSTGLSGCHATQLAETTSVYASIVQLALRSTATPHAVLQLLTIDFQPCDFEWLAAFEVLQSLVVRGKPCGDKCPVWLLLPLASVRALLTSGVISKKDLLEYMLACPHTGITSLWWSSRGFDSKDVTTMLSTKSIADVVALYRQFSQTVRVCSPVCTPAPEPTHAPQVAADFDEDMDEDALLAQALAMSLVQDAARSAPASSSSGVGSAAANGHTLMTLYDSVEATLSRRRVQSVMALLIALYSGGLEARRKTSYQLMCTSAIALSARADEENADVTGPRHDVASKLLAAPDTNDPDESAHSVNGTKTLQTAAGNALGSSTRCPEVIVWCQQALTSQLFAFVRLLHVASGAPDLSLGGHTDASGSFLDTSVVQAEADLHQLMLTLVRLDAVVTHPTVNVPCIAALLLLLSRCGSLRVIRLATVMLNSVASAVSEADVAAIVAVMGLDKSSSPTRDLVAFLVDILIDRGQVVGGARATLSDPVSHPQGFGRGYVDAVICCHVISVVTTWCQVPGIKPAVDQIVNAVLKEGVATLDSIDDNTTATSIHITKLQAACAVLATLDGSIGRCVYPGCRVLVHDSPLLTNGRGLAEIDSVSNQALATAMVLSIDRFHRWAVIAFQSASSNVGFDTNDTAVVEMDSLETVPARLPLQLDASVWSVMEVILSRPPPDAMSSALVPVPSVGDVSLSGGDVVDEPAQARPSASPDVDDKTVTPAPLATLLKWKLYSRAYAYVGLALCDPASVQLLLGSSMVTEIVSQALETVKFNSFIALRRLYERGFTLDSRIRDAASFGFENMFGPVDVNAPDVIPTRHNEVVSGAGGAAAPVSAEPVLSPQEAARLEMAQMLVMVYGMFDVDDCVIALKRNNDDPDRAANWLMDDSSQRVLRAERDAKANSPGKGGTAANKSSSVQKDSARLQKAQELSGIYGLPVDMSFHALRIFHENPDRAMEWLMDEGVQWVRMQQDEAFKEGERVANAKAEALALERERQSDTAALDDIGSAELLTSEAVTSSSNGASVSTPYTGNAPESTSDVMSFHRAALGPHEASFDAVIPPSSTGATVPDPLGLTPNMLVYCVNPAVVPSQARVTLPAGTVMASGIESLTNGHTVVYLRTCDPWSGVSDCITVSATCAAKPATLFGWSLPDMPRLYGASIANDAAITIHSARRMIAAIVAHWPPKIPLSVDVFGGSENVIQLIKLVAASDGVFHTNNQVDSASIPSTTMRSLRRLLGQLLSNEHRSVPGQGHRKRVRRHSTEDSSDLLSSVLLRECVSHFKLEAPKSSRRGSSEGRDRLMTESLHPRYHTCDYKGEVHIPNAKSIRVTFDHRCALGPKDSLTLYSDKGFSNKIVKLTGSDWQPLVVNADRVYYRFIAEKGGDDAKAWGYRFYVSAVTGLQWQNESQVLHDRSLEWASWLLRFLLRDGAPTPDVSNPPVPGHGVALMRSPSMLSSDITGGMIHNATVSDAIVRYIRTPNMQYKHRAVALLTQLLKAPQLFPLDKLPDMTVIHSMCDLALQRCLTDRSSSKQLFLAESLLMFVELSVTAATAQRVFDARMELKLHGEGPEGIGCAAGAGHRHPLIRVASGVEPRPRAVRLGIGAGFADIHVDTDATVPLWPPFEVSLPGLYMPPVVPAASVSSMPQPPALTKDDILPLLCDVSDLSHCLMNNSRIPDRLLCRAWLDSIGNAAFATSPHPLFPPGLHAKVPASDPSGWVKLTGKLSIPGVGRMVVQLDSRTRLPKGSKLVVKDNSGRVVTGIGGAVTREDGEDFEWFTSRKHECVVLDHTVTYEFEAHVAHCTAPVTGYWGFGLSAFSDQPKPDNRAARLASYETLLARKSDLEVAVRQMAAWNRDADAALVQYLNERADELGRPVVTVPASECKLSKEQFAFKFDVLDAFPVESLHLRISIIRLLNCSLDRCLEMFDSPSVDVTNSVASTLRQLGHLLFSDIKTKRLEAAVEATKRSHATNIGIQLDNMRGMLSVDRGTVDPDSSECLFVQAYHQLGRKDPKLWRCVPDGKGSLFQVKYVGEEGLDWGGVFRDAITRIVEDLFSSRFSLMTLCPNGVAQDGLNMDKYVPNPKHFASGSASRVLPMFEFAGRLMGASLRLKLCLPFDFPSLVWKQLVGQPVDVSDVEAIDSATEKMLTDMKLLTGNDSEFKARFPDVYFTAVTADGRTVELKKGGASIAVNATNCGSFMASLVQYKLHEFDAAIAALRRGLFSAVPERAIRLLTWKELDAAVGGKPEINVDLLERNTEYEGYDASDPAIKRFWKVLRSFTNEEKSLFIKFVWGRSRLPIEKRWPKKLKIQRRVVPDTDLPIAHTCFFSVELPPYSTEAIMRHKLLTAVHFGAGGILNI